MKRNRESGQALVVAALCMTVLTLAAGLAIDMGYLRYQRRRTQAAADAAAIAGAAAISYGATQIVSEAQADAASNGFNGTCNGSPSVCVYNPPISAGAVYDGNASAVEVVVSQNQPTFFMRAMGINTVPVSARAVALVGNGQSCVYGLGPSPNAGIISVGVNLQVSASCAVLSNGDINLTTYPYPGAFTATSIGDGSGNCTGCSPAAQKIIPPTDPLAYLPNQSNPGSCSGGPAVFTNVTTTVPSGSYPCGIVISGGGTVTLDGTYVLGGSGAPCPHYPNLDPYILTNLPPTASCSLAIIGIGNVQSGPDGVTLYNYSGSIEINSGAEYSSCSAGPPTQYLGSTVQLTAPTTGTYPGIVMMQDPGNTQLSTLTLGNGDDCSGNSYPASASYVAGAIYVPNAQLYVDGIGIADNGCSTQPRFTTLVAYTLQVAGNLNIGTNDCVSPATNVQNTLPNPIKSAVLVE